MTARNLFILAAAAGLSGCLSLLPDPAPAPAVYRLESSVQPAVKRASAEIIRIDRPSASQIFSSGDIVVTEGGTKLSAIAQAKWAETIPELIQTAMIDTLQGSPQFIGLTPTTGTRTKTRLHIVVKNFEANFDNGSKSPPLAVVQYSVTYAGADDRTLIGTHMVRETVRANSINVSSIVAAMEDANEAAMSDIVTWLEGRKSQSGS